MKWGDQEHALSGRWATEHPGLGLQDKQRDVPGSVTWVVP